MSDRIGVAARILAAVALILLCTFLPFLPGRYDLLAMPLSWMARALGWLSLLVVPFGALWFFRPRRGFAMATLVAAGVVGALMVFVTLALGAPSLAVILFAALVLGLNRARRSQSRGLALGFAIVPSIVLPVQLLLVPRAVEFSRHRAIANAATMIADIETAREQHGEYPPSALGGVPDYKPGIIGIEKYHYERAGRAYNLIFENPAVAFGTDEYVVYNPFDEQYFTAHARDAIQLSPAQLVLERTRGHYAVRDAPFPHWKYFWFD